MAHRLAPAEVLDSVSQSLIEAGNLSDGVLVDLAPERATKYLERVILAAWIRTTDVIGIWSIRENPWGTGPIFALDGAAREWTDWGSAAKGGSKFEEERIKVLSYPEVAEAREAARALGQWRWPAPT